MGEAILVTSGKGGVGKTTFTSNIGAALAKRGKKVLLVDANFGLRNLDIALGMAQNVIYDLYDVTEGKCEEQKAIIPHFHYPNLYLIGAPQDVVKRRVDPAKLKDFIAKEKDKYDYLFLDCAAGIGEAFTTAAGACDSAIIVTIPNLYSMRDGERVSLCLEDNGLYDFKMVINRVNTKLMKKKGILNIDDMIDGVRARLLGIVPEDSRLEEDMILGKMPFLDRYVKANKAFANIARRICKETVPIMKLR